MLNRKGTKSNRSWNRGLPSLLIVLALLAAGLALSQAQTAKEVKCTPEPVKLNPYTGDLKAIQEGRQLYFKYNCNGCHSSTAAGGMGPNLVDAAWLYGGTDACVFESIKMGRPKGMPAFGPLADGEIWKIIAFLRSLYRGPQEKVVW